MTRSTIEPIVAPTGSAVVLPTDAASPKTTPIHPTHAQEAPTVDPDPTARPVVSPTPGQPVKTATVQPPPDEDDVWRAAAALPRGTTITGLLYTYEFIVGANVAAPKDGCADRTEAHVWTSDDGSDWFDVFVGNKVYGSVDVLTGPYITSAMGDWSVDCDAAPAMWRPTDKSDWYQLDVLGLASADELVDGIAILESYSVVVTGSAADDPDHMAVWTAPGSMFDVTFGRATRPPERRYNETLSSLVATDEAVVGFDGTSTVPAWYSLDFGDTWQNTGFQPPFWFYTTDAEAAQDQVFAAGFACCTLGDDRVGVVQRSGNGTDWTADEAALMPTIPQAIVGTDTQLVALGEQTYVSRDGVDWRVAAPLPGYVSGDSLFAAVGEGLLMIASPSHIWVASLEDLDPDRWTEPVAKVELPQVGGSYPGALSTHCGPLNGPLYFGLRMWVPDAASLPNGEFPRSFGDPREPGTLTLTAADRLEFHGEHGDVVFYEPTDSPPESFPCA